MIEKTITSPANVEGFLKNLRNFFVNVSFEIQSNDKDGFVMINKQRLNNNRQNPLVGVSEISVHHIGDQINIQADIKNAERLKRFAIFFPPALAVGLGILFAILTFAGAMPKSVVTWALPLGMALFFPVIFIPIGKMIEKATISALDTAIHNAAAMADEE